MATTERDLQRRLRPPTRRTNPRVPRTRDIGIQPVRQPQARPVDTSGLTPELPRRGTGITGGFAPFAMGRQTEQFLDTAGTIQPINPERSLRGTQILPRTSGALPAVTQQAGRVSQAAGAIPAFQGIGTPTTTGLPAFQGIATPTRTGLPAFQTISTPASTGLPAFQGVAAPTELPVSEDVTQARALTGQALQGVMDLPSRQALAAQTFQNLIEQAEESQVLGTRDIGQEAARLGRLGSGQVTTSLGDLNLALRRGLGRQARGLAAETAGQTLADQLAQLSAGTGTAQALQGLDLSRAGFEQGLRGEARGELGREFQQGLAGLGAEQALRGEARGERAAGLEAGLARLGAEQALRGEARGERAAGLEAGLAQLAAEQGLREEARGERQAGLEFGLAGLGAQTGALGALQGLEGQRFGQEAALRGELRGERAFQDVLAREAQQAVLNQLAVENALLGQAGSLGFGQGDPSAALLGAAGQRAAGAQAAGGAAGDIASQLAFMRAMGLI